MSRSKYINTFNTTAEYDSYIESALPAFPNVCYDKEAGKVNIVKTPRSSHLIWGTTNETSDFTVYGGATFTVDTIENIFYTDTWDNSITDYGNFFENAPFITVKKMQIDTSNVTNMGALFTGCSSITSLDLSSLDTSNVTNMNYMFTGCSSITSLDLSNFNTSNVTDMSCMLQDCVSLTSLDLSNWDTSSVTDENFVNMFVGCYALTDVYITVEATLMKLTNNLSSQGDSYYIPSNNGNCTIHYNDVDYKWQNNAWRPQSV